MTSRTELEMIVQDRLGFMALLQEGRASKLLARYDLNRSQFTLLFKLGLEPERRWTITEIEQHFEMNAPGISKMVSYLAPLGWLSVEADDEDKRKKQIAITESGLKKRDETLAALVPAVADIFAEWSEDELKDFLKHLDKLVTWLDTHRDDV